MLESTLQPSNSFITLTYTDETLPRTTDGLPQLSPRDLSLWLKRLRKEMHPLRLRYYGVGEYSPVMRPHYHVILFGLPPCKRGQTRTDYKGTVTPSECCATCAMIHRLWSRYESNGEITQLGGIHCGQVMLESAAYVAGYVEKKLSKNGSDHILMGREPEFSRMSLRPGIGADFVHEIASALMTYDLELKMEDVPSALQHGKRRLPLDPYMKGKLREAIGREKKAPPEVIQKVKENLSELRKSAFDNSRSFKKEIIDHYEQQVLNIETRLAIFKSRNKGKLK